MKSLICPGCTASMKLDLAGERAVCEYCGRIMVFTSEDELIDYEEYRIQKEKDEWEERMRIAREARRLETDEAISQILQDSGILVEEAPKESVTAIWISIIGMAALFGFCFVIVVIVLFLAIFT